MNWQDNCDKQHIKGQETLTFTVPDKILSRGIDNKREFGDACASSSLPAHVISDIEDETQRIYKLNELMNQLDIENKIKEGAENLLQVFDVKTVDQQGENHAALRRKIELELDAVNVKIAQIKMQVNEIRSSSLNTKNKQNISRKQYMENSNTCHDTSQYTTHSLSSKDEKNECTETIDPEKTLKTAFERLDETIRDPFQYIKSVNYLISIFKSYPALKYELDRETLNHHLRNMFSSQNTDIIACGYRLSRHVVYNIESILFLKKLHIEYVLIRSFAKDSTASNEREQALKLVRSFYEIKDGIFEISKSVSSAIVSLAEHSGDKMSSICIETLAEMLILDPALIVASGGNKVLLQTLSNGPFEILNELIKLFIYLLDIPSTRKFVRPQSDLQLIVSHLTDIHPMMEEYKLKYCADGIITMIKSWSGLLYMSMYDMQAIRSLVDTLRISSSKSKDIILNLLYNIFGIQSSSVTSTFLAGRRLTTWGRPLPAPQQELQNENVFSNKIIESGRNDLSQQFLALTVIVFVDIGILDALVAVAENSTDKMIFRKATLLIVELLQLANRILPLEYGAKLQFLPKLFISSLEFNNKFHSMATSVLLQIESLNKAKMKISSIQQKKLYSNSESFLKRGLRQLEQIKLKLGLQIDDIRFRTLLLDTQVLSTKNYKKWRWDILVELLQGPLLNPKRLEESIRSTKFMKRLLSFYRPFNYRFSNIKQTKPNQRYVRIGRMIFTTLLANPEGVRYLADSKLLKQISECLAQLDPINGISCPCPLFSRQRLEETLTSGYFVLLGTLSENKEGIAMMEKLKIFNMFYHLTELRSRDDLILNFIVNMDYTFHGHPRIILSKALTTGLKDVRLFVTKYLGTLLSSSKKTLTKNAKIVEWAICLLVTQLYDPSIEVCQMAVQVLEKACYDLENLQYTVKLRPMLEHLGDIGAPLRLRFLASSIGFNYLKEFDYIEKEMDNWFHKQNESYVGYVEKRLSLAFSFENNNDFDNLIPPHFYGEIIKTSEGCQLLKKKGHFEYFVSYISNNKDQYEDKNIIVQLKSSLWAIGNIGSHSNGSSFLENSGVIPDIVYIAEKSQVISLRGTAFFVLGLISITTSVSKILEQYGWISVFTSFGTPIGICVPKNIKKILFLEPWHYQSCSSDLEDDVSKLVLKNDAQASILKAVIDLSSHILANKAVRSLSKLKLKYPEEFKSFDLYKSVLKILTRYHYRQPVRKFILEMFSCDIFYQNH
ncbi:hypothetical protein PORY_000859 [Pneumocystis oryctolagi]|uniref:Uncharacterized protein n=1 Tax=Pneumocystis oryctolagi TaxID=42067 RepID=A0ACB7CDX0_9ASCO|nr:hypothetical protein PORY_000859 [Pneumocystis oryctolagi]